MVSTYFLGSASPILTTLGQLLRTTIAAEKTGLDILSRPDSAKYQSVSQEYFSKMLESKNLQFASSGLKQPPYSLATAKLVLFET
jgi:hypothetical protein